MPFVIHRSPVPPARRLVLVGGDVRWVRPLIRLVEAFGFSTTWFERSTHLRRARLQPSDVLVVADDRTAQAIVRDRALAAEPPLVVLTGSLHGLSTPIPGDAVSLPLPLTLESLATVLAIEDPTEDIAEKRAAG